jgi:hypothetical protein
VPLSEITEVWPGYSGIELHRSGRRKVTAWAVQKMNVSWMTNRRTRSDEVAAAIEERLRQDCRPSRTSLE